MSVELISSQERAERNYIHRANKAGNRTLNRRTQKNGVSYKTILGYNTVTTCLSQENMPIGDLELSGSTFTRYNNKKRKDELQKGFEEQKEIEAAICKKNDENGKYFREIYSLRAIAHSKRGYKRPVPAKLFKRSQSLHFLSTRSKGKIRDKGIALSRCLGKKQTFVTLTFINDVTDADGIKILGNYLNTLRKIHGKFQYWRVSERQENGRIHFHLIFNMFLAVRKYNALWITTQYNAGLQAPDITREMIDNWITEDNETPWKKSVLQKHLNPFDAKKIQHIYGLNYYLTKYVTKNKNKGFGCSAWHCSRGVSRLFTKKTVSRSFIQAAAMPMHNSRLDKKTGEIIQPRPVVGRFHQLFYINNRLYFLPEMAHLEEINRYIINGNLDFEGLRRCLN